MPVLTLMCARDGKTSMGAAKLILNPWPKKPSCRDKDNNFMAPSSNGLGGRPLKSAMYGSNPTGVTKAQRDARSGGSLPDLGFLKLAKPETLKTSASR